MSEGATRRPDVYLVRLTLVLPTVVFLESCGIRPEPAVESAQSGVPIAE